MNWLARLGGAGRWRWYLWGALLLAWTAALIVPVPNEVRWPVVITYGPKYYLSKALHLGVFTFLTVMAGGLKPRFRWRLVLLFVLMAHAAATEWAQLELTHLEVTKREGKLQDVILDHCGIALGLVLSWKWWTKEG